MGREDRRCAKAASARLHVGVCVCMCVSSLRWPGSIFFLEPEPRASGLPAPLPTAGAEAAPDCMSAVTHTTSCSEGEADQTET